MLNIAIWNSNDLRWDHSWRPIFESRSEEDTRVTVDNVKYDSNDKSVTFSASRLMNEYGDIRVAIIAREFDTDAAVVVSPNPFSPFVSPLSDFIALPGMSGNVKGTCIKITPKSNATRFKPSAQVAIYTAEGTLVYRATLNGLDAGRTYYLFWDGRTQLSQTALSGIDIAPNQALFVPGNALCRNGRYFLNVTINDGKEKKRYTREIILFK
jgi:hypothetical protein